MVHIDPVMFNSFAGSIYGSHRSSNVRFICWEYLWLSQIQTLPHSVLLVEFGFEAERLEGALHHLGQVYGVALESAPAGRATLPRATLPCATLALATLALASASRVRSRVQSGLGGAPQSGLVHGEPARVSQNPVRVEIMPTGAGGHWRRGRESLNK